jgi:hypothetical protein
MGIDIYMRWQDQPEAERSAQYTGFSIAHGHAGYLREAYHGRVYATRVLVPEAFNDDPDRDYEAGVAIPAAVLAARLPDALAAARTREAVTYGLAVVPDDHPALQSLRDFVALAVRLEAEGKQPRIVASY